MAIRVRNPLAIYAGAGSISGHIPMPLDKIRQQLKLAQEQISRERPSARPTLDARDARIAELEAALAEATEHAETLRTEADALRFRNETLETSYAKQLETARERAEAAEQALDEQNARLAELEQFKADCDQKMTAVQTELERVRADRDRLHRLVDPAAGESELSIDDMLDNAAWQREQERIASLRREGSGTSEPKDPTVAELLAPEDLLLEEGERKSGT